MKKLICAIALLIMLAVLIMPVFVFAEELHPPEAEQQTMIPAAQEPQNEAYTWVYLATIAGATAATLLIVQYLKLPLDKIWKIPTRIVVYVIALILLLVATAFTTGLNLQNGLLAAVNAFVVALAAYGSYELTFAKIDRR